MKVLVAHDHYRSSAPSGEDAVYRNERNLLESRGLDVVPFECFNDDIEDGSLAAKIRVAADTAWSRRTYARLSELIRRARPDVAHFHNTFPLMSPSVYAACRDHSVPVVQTLHNYRLICAGAMLTRNGRPCEQCVGHAPWPALRHRCYRDSLPATSAVVWMLTRNRARRTYETLVDRYIALTRFAAEKLVAGGLPPDRMELKPNFLPRPRGPGAGDGNYAVFVGRLSREKGLRTLLEAWKAVKGLPLKIVGDGPLRPDLEDTARRNALAVEFVGRRTSEEVLDLLASAALCVVPSEWYEGFPMVVVEAYSCGTPVVASRIGSLSEIVVEGVTGAGFEPGNAADLAARVSALVANRPRLAALRRTTRAEFDSLYTADRSYETLLAIYSRAIENRRAVQ